jgi:hypothetical protein
LHYVFFKKSVPWNFKNTLLNNLQVKEEVKMENFNFIVRKNIIHPYSWNVDKIVSGEEILASNAYI